MPFSMPRLIRPLSLAALAASVSIVPLNQAFAQEELSGSIRFSWYGGQTRNEKIDHMVNLFQKRHPGTTINQEPLDWPSYWERLGVQAAGNNLPCLVGMLPFNIAEYAGRGLLADFQPQIDSGAISLDEISPDLVAASRWSDGKLLMLPYGAAPDTITYNATLAEAAGIEPLPESYDWDAFFDWLLAAQASLPADIWAIDSPANNPDLLLAYIGSHGYKVYEGETLGFPKELLVAWFTEWHELNAGGAMVPADMLSEEPGAHELSYFAAGRSLASQRPANALAALQGGVAARGSGDILVTQLYPIGPEGVGDFVPVNSLSMAASCDNVPLAAAFADFFLNDPEAGEIFASDNGAVTNAALLQSQVNNADTPAPVRALLETFQQVNERGSVAQTFPARFQSRFTEVHKRLVMEVLFGSLTPQQAADTFFTEAE